MDVAYTPQFRRQFRKLSEPLQEETLEKIATFANPKNHARLKVHKLHGPWKGTYSFSVNYRFRIIFEWEKEGKSAILLAIGDHSIYE